jgi:hypothetical protein
VAVAVALAVLVIALVLGDQRLELREHVVADVGVGVFVDRGGGGRVGDVGDDDAGGHAVGGDDALDAVGDVEHFGAGPRAEAFGGGREVGHRCLPGVQRRPRIAVRT